jgi:thiamine pyrophosphate-dependent acetolactate synthase large subunit-like protein
MVPFWQTTNPRTYIGWGNSTQLGTGLGLALGAQLAAPQKQAINVMGDTAVGMAGIDFETAVRERIPLITVILNNSAMGGYEKNIPLAAERYRTKYLTGDYMSMTQSLGSFSQRVERPGEIVPAIRRALESTAAGHPAVLEFITREDPMFSS